MAKGRKQVEVLEPVKLDVDKTLKEYTEVLLSGTEVTDKPKKIIPVSPRLDTGLYGGIPQGAWVIIAGPEKTGKTTLSLNIATQCQKEGMKVVYADIEHRLEPRNLTDTKGLIYDDLNKFVLVRSTENRLLSAQDYLTILYNYLKSEKNLLVILDSVSMLCDAKEQEEGIGAQMMGGGGPKLLAQFARLISEVIKIRKHIAIAIVHNMANISKAPVKKEKTRKSGFAIRYAQDILIDLTYAEPWKVGEEMIGHQVHYTIENTPLGRPGAKVQGRHRFGIGIDHLFELAELGVDCGLIDKTGAWYALDFLQGTEGLSDNEKYDEKKKTIKVQGLEAVYNILENNPSWTSLLQEKIKEYLQ